MSTRQPLVSVGNIKFGLKGLQICANSIMPQIMHLSQGIALLFPTHAEQFNQNIMLEIQDLSDKKIVKSECITLLNIMM